MEMQHYGWDFTYVEIMKTHEPNSLNTQRKENWLLYCKRPVRMLLMTPFMG